MACDQRIRKCTNLAKHRLSTDPTKEVIFLKIGYADYFFDFRIGFPTSKTAENYRNIFGTMKTKLAVPERTCASSSSSSSSLLAVESPYCVPYHERLGNVIGNTIGNAIGSAIGRQ